MLLRQAGFTQPETLGFMVNTDNHKVPASAGRWRRSLRNKMQPLSGASPASSGFSIGVGRWIWWAMGARQLGAGLGGTGKRRGRQSSTAHTTRGKRSLVWLADVVCGTFQVSQLSFPLKHLSASHYTSCCATLSPLQGAVCQHWAKLSARTGQGVWEHWSERS